MKCTCVRALVSEFSVIFNDVLGSDTNDVIIGRIQTTFIILNDVLGSDTNDIRNY